MVLIAGAYFVGNMLFSKSCNCPPVPLEVDCFPPLAESGTLAPLEETIALTGEVVVAGVGPDISFQPTVAPDTLVLKRYVEYTVQYFFVEDSSQKGLNANDLLP